MDKTDEVNRVGMMSKRTGLYDDEMKIMEGVNYAYKLTSPISESAGQKIKQAVSDGNINMLKNLLK